MVYAPRGLQEWARCNIYSKIEFYDVRKFFLKQEKYNTDSKVTIYVVRKKNWKLKMYNIDLKYLIYVVHDFF